MKLKDILKYIDIIDLIKRLLGAVRSDDVERALTIYQRVRSAELQLRSALVGLPVHTDPIRGFKVFGHKFTVLMSFQREE